MLNTSESLLLIQETCFGARFIYMLRLRGEGVYMIKGFDWDTVSFRASLVGLGLVFSVFGSVERKG